jgi:hypothetical protein
MPVQEDALYDIIQNTWTSTLGLEVNRSSSPVPTGAGQITAHASISGAWNGEVCLQCPQPLARLVAGAFFQVEASRAGDDQILDALSELVHIVGGNLKGLLPQPITLSLPSSSNRAERGLETRNTKPICQLLLQSSGYPFSVSLLAGMPQSNIESLPVGQNSQSHADRR